MVFIHCINVKLLLEKRRDSDLWGLVGGGVKSSMLCRMTACACGVPVVAGPVEGAVLGNIGIQLIRAGALPDIAGFREIVRGMPDIRRYESRDWEAFDKAYGIFQGVVKC